MLDGFGRLGAGARRRRDAAIAQAARRAPPSRRSCGRQLAPFGARQAHAPGRLPGRRRTSFPAPPARRSRRCLPPACRSGASRSARPATTTRTTTRPSASPTASSSTADCLLAFQRDLEARGLADRVLTHVWSEFGRRAEENGSEGTDHGAAGVGFLIGTRANGTMVGEFPASTVSTRTATCGRRSDFRARLLLAARAVVRARRRRGHPRRRSFARPAVIR